MGRGGDPFRGEVGRRETEPAEGACVWGLGPRAGPVFGNEGIRRPLRGREDVDSEKLRAVGDAREAGGGGGQENKGVPAAHVVEKGANQGDPEDEEAGVTGKETWRRCMMGLEECKGQVSCPQVQTRGRHVVPWPGTE